MRRMTLAIYNSVLSSMMEDEIKGKRLNGIAQLLQLHSFTYSVLALRYPLSIHSLQLRHGDLPADQQPVRHPLAPGRLLHPPLRPAARAGPLRGQAEPAVLLPRQRRRADALHDRSLFLFLSRRP